MSQAVLTSLIKSRIPLIWIKSYEEARVLDCIQSVAQSLKYQTAIWSCTKGYQHTAGSLLKGGDKKDARSALAYPRDGVSADSRALFLICDFHPYLTDSEIIRGLREAAADLKRSKKTIIFLGPVTKIPVELEKDLTVIEWGLPDRAEIIGILHALHARTLPTADPKERLPEAIKIDPATFPAIAEACLGLVRQEIDQALGRSMVDFQCLDPRSIMDIKRGLIQKSGLLDFYPATVQMSDVGGMDGLKGWLSKRKRAFSPAARAFGLPDPKGVLLTGIPGVGKSLIAKAIGAAWGLPIVKLDLGRMFGGLVGASEENMRKAIAVAESVSPCILWIDEVEKGFSGVGSSDRSDGGTTARVFGTFLTWLQDKTSQVFVVATANDVTRLPPEFLRKGRFDELFFVDLPDSVQRSEIFRIHLNRRGQAQAISDVEDFSDLVSATDGFSGAEIENVVISALYDAFDADQPLSAAHLLRAVQEVTPLSVTQAERIQESRKWAESRARKA